MAKVKKVYPGVDSHNLNIEKKKKSYLPLEGITPHYSDPPCLRLYKTVLQKLAAEGLKPHGNVDYDKKKKRVIIKSELGANVIAEISIECKDELVLHAEVDVHEF
jgi:hypothetical protein